VSTIDEILRSLSTDALVQQLEITRTLARKLPACRELARRMADSDARSAIVRAAADRSAAVRIEVYWALSTLGLELEDEAVGIVARAIVDERDSDARRHAIQAAGRLRAHRCRSQLIEALRAYVGRVRDGAGRFEAEHTLATLTSTPADPAR
jgi:hypothetical protein